MKKVLVANRGEIALRVMRACRESGLVSVGVHAAGELDALHVSYADEAVELVSGQPLPYLDIDAIIRAAVASGADAIHPGYGFLAENAAFANACESAGITFVGPSAKVIATMGDKVRAREAARRADVPVVPGSDGPVDIASARANGDAIGYPIALKAVAGGGGRGFRVVHSPEELDAAWKRASGEAERYFGDASVYAERYLDRPRHIEIQIMADQHNNVVGLGERDCSIQRRHQKLVEESPSPALDARLREEMNDTAVQLARSVGYAGAGTVEFLYCAGRFYFLEMNTRIQVEHPVTEQVTGIDLVREQLNIAAGEPLSFANEPGLWGHAIECRINAEDPARDFAPTPGRLSAFSPPTGFGIRVDSGYVRGSVIDARFDNLIAKLIVTGRDREEALSRLNRALMDFDIDGVATTIPLYRALLRHPEFVSGDYDTGFLVRSGLPDRMTPFDPTDVGGDDRVVFEVNGRSYVVKLPASLRSNSGTSASRRRPRHDAGERRGFGSNPTTNELHSPIQGTVLSVAVQPGEPVESGQVVCVIEAMKMENEIQAHRSGTISELHVSSGQTVGIGELIARIDV